MNWSSYNQSLVRRGEILLGFDVINNWDTELKDMNKDKVGEPFHYPNTFLLLPGYAKAYFHLPYRQTEGIAQGHAKWKVLSIPDYSTFAHRRLQRIESRLKSKTKQPSLLFDETKTTIKSKIDVIEKLTDEDFDILIVMLKSLRRTLLEDSKTSSKCSKCSIVYHSKPKFCSNCGLDLNE